MYLSKRILDLSSREITWRQYHNTFDCANDMSSPDGTKSSESVTKIIRKKIRFI